MAPVPARNLTHDSPAPSATLPTNAPISNWAIAPTTISDKAVAMRSQIDNRLATKASPNQSEAINQVSVIDPVLPAYRIRPAT